tara:strand:- start:430 stop:1149 length:720 start_codon:yes stop_codon:yes gene_type:complete
MNAIILVAGRGSRLNRYTKYNPKALIKFKNNTLLQNQINNLNINNINNICLITGYMKDKFIKYKVKKIYNKNWRKSNMIYSLLLAKKILLRKECIISYGDIFYESNAISKLKNCKSNFCLLNNKNYLKNWQSRYKNPLKDLETFKFDKKNFITEIGNKTKKYHDIRGQFMGLFKTKPMVWKKIFTFISSRKLNIQNISTTEFLNYFITNKILKIKVINYTNKWYEVDNSNDLIYLKKDN